MTDEPWFQVSGVKCVACPECAFTFDRGHEDVDGGYSCPCCAELRLRLLLQDIGHELLQAEVHCPCGARPESPATHPHVTGCPIGNAIALFESAAAPLGGSEEETE